MDELRSLAETGSGVKAMKAKAELEQMRVRSQTGANMAEVRAAWKTRKAKKDLEKGDPMAEEMKRVRLMSIAVLGCTFQLQDCELSFCVFYCELMWALWAALQVEAKKKAEEEEAERKKRESRDKLKARAAFLNQS